jgi:hypothetical protein
MLALPVPGQRERIRYRCGEAPPPTETALAMTSSLHRLFYVSTCCEKLQPDAIRAILRKARAYNTAHSITGFLIYSGTHFAQVLEGDESELRSLAGSLQRDPRHRDMRVLLSESSEARLFTSWSMGFVQDLSVADLLSEVVAVPVEPPRASRLIELLFRHADLKPLS